MEVDGDKVWEIGRMKYHRNFFNGVPFTFERKRKRERSWSVLKRLYRGSKLILVNLNVIIRDKACQFAMSI